MENERQYEGKKQVKTPANQKFEWLYRSNQQPADKSRNIITLASQDSYGDFAFELTGYYANIDIMQMEQNNYYDKLAKFLGILNGALVRNLRNDALSLEETVKASATTAFKQYAKQSGAGTSEASEEAKQIFVGGSLVREKNGKLECMVFGSSTVYLELIDGQVVQITDPNYEQCENGVLEEVKSLSLWTSSPIAEIMRTSIEPVSNLLGMARGEGGFSCIHGGAKSADVFNSKIKSIKTTLVKSVLLANKGFADISKVYVGRDGKEEKGEEGGSSTSLEILKSGHILEAKKEVKRLQSEDKNFKKFPRLSDDYGYTAIYLKMRKGC